MLFWFGLLVALVAGLLSIGFSREAVKLRFSVVGDYHLDVAAVVLLIFGLALSAVEHYRIEQYIDTATQAEKKQRHRKTRRSHLSSKRVKTRAEASERSSGLVA